MHWVMRDEYDHSVGRNLVVFQIQVPQVFCIFQCLADAFCAVGAEVVPLEIQTFQRVAVFDQFAEDFQSHIGNIIERKVDMSDDLW